MPAFARSDFHVFGALKESIRGQKANISEFLSKVITDDETFYSTNSKQILGCNQKFPDWPPKERAANGIALCH